MLPEGAELMFVVRCSSEVSSGLCELVKSWCQVREKGDPMREGVDNAEQTLQLFLSGGALEFKEGIDVCVGWVDGDIFVRS